jgi:hypothetical protein
MRSSFICEIGLYSCCEAYDECPTALADGQRDVPRLGPGALASYLIFAQDEVKAWVYNRNIEKQFPPGPQVFVGADASINIPALKIDLPLIDIYARLDFD